MFGRTMRQSGGARQAASAGLVLQRRTKLNVAAAKARMEAVKSIISMTTSMKSTAQAKLPYYQDILPRNRPFTEICERVSASGVAALEDSPKKISCLVVGSDKGLCGPMNVKLLRTLRNYNMNERPDADVTYVVAGKQGRSRMGGRDRQKVIASFTGLDKLVKRQGFNWDSVVQISEALLSIEESEGIEIWYNYFVNQSNFPMARRVIPGGALWEKSVEESLNQYEWEGDEAEMSQNLREFCVGALVHGSLVENATSEQASRAQAMGSASQNAEEIYDNLKRESAKARQDGVTNELMDLVGGTKAVKVLEGIED